jgi:hypothetical protein
MNLQDTGTIIGLGLTGAGLVFTGIGLTFAGMQLRVAQRTAHGEFLLNLDEMFWHHDKTHRRLRPGGDWSKKGTGPSEEDFEAWTDVESYMGLFERINVLVKEGIIDLDTVNRFYGYRISNIVNNDRIREGKLENPKTKGGWRDFIELARALKRYL